MNLTVRAALRINPKGIAFFSPRLRVTELPWVAMTNQFNPNGVAANSPNEAQPLQGCESLQPITQGSSQARNPGLVTESRWDSPSHRFGVPYRAYSRAASALHSNHFDL